MFLECLSRLDSDRDIYPLEMLGISGALSHCDLAEHLPAPLTGLGLGLSSRVRMCGVRVRTLVRLGWVGFCLTLTPE